MTGLEIAMLVIAILKFLDERDKNKKQVKTADVKKIAKAIGREKEVKKIAPMLSDITWIINRLLKGSKK